MSERLATGAARLLERRASRRGLLSRVALSGAALAVAPIRYLVRPTTAWAVLRPSQCPSGSRCNDGWTEFCCQINRGRNTCPAHTYVAGWWKCTDYGGTGLCHQQGSRYYIDCNRIPGRRFPGGCRCAGGCHHRRVDCNRFRYGQCNTEVAGTTEVVCRVVVCEHPSTIDAWRCNSTYKVDNSVCGHEAPCLTPLVVQLPGGGGA